MLNPVCLMALSALATTPTPALAQLDPDSLLLAQNTRATSAPMVGGEVRKVDKEAGKITLKHDAIPNLEMPGMTMVFRVKDPAMLDKVKPGDKVRFAADKVGGAITVTQIEPAK
jgi:Cu(I)/Ag(I) efflux system periplasmic protein CusF